MLYPLSYEGWAGHAIGLLTAGEVKVSRIATAVEWCSYGLTPFARLLDAARPLC